MENGVREYAVTVHQEQLQKYTRRSTLTLLVWSIPFIDFLSLFVPRKVLPSTVEMRKMRSLTLQDLPSLLS